MVNSILITVRTSSTRLPRKAILDINGKPTIQYLIENIKKSKLADKIILCTSEEPDDDIPVSYTHLTLPTKRIV